MSTDLPPMSEVKHSPGQLTELRSRHHEIVRRFVEGADTGEIAAEMGLSDRAVRNCLNSDLAKMKISELQRMADIESADITQIIHQGAAAAAHLLRDIVNGVGEGAVAKLAHRSRVGLEMLKMDGFTPVTRSVSLTGYLPKEGVEALKTHSRVMQKAYPSGSYGGEGAGHSLAPLEEDTVNVLVEEVS